MSLFPQSKKKALKRHSVAVFSRHAGAPPDSPGAGPTRSQVRARYFTLDACQVDPPFPVRRGSVWPKGAMKLGTGVFRAKVGKKGERVRRAGSGHPEAPICRIGTPGFGRTESGCRMESLTQRIPGLAPCQHVVMNVEYD